MRRVPPAPPALSSPAPAAGNQTTPSTSHTFYPSPIDTILAEQGLQRYHIAPPSWRAPWIADATAGGAGSTGGSAVGRSTGRSSSGIATASIAGTAAEGKANAWPVFYPPRDGMDEDQMTEQVVKAGYVSKAIVQAETFSAHQHIYDKLKTTDILGNLSRLVGAVKAKAATHLPGYGPSTFRLPSRITLTDAKREAWFSDLASPSIPLSKLSRSVPHGYKGEKGLDMLAHRKVDVPRAVWFVRAFGGVEIQSLVKTRPSSVAIAHYTSEFTTVVSEFIRKQLAEVVVPSASISSATSTPAATPLPVPGTPGTTASALAGANASLTRARSASTSSNAAAVKAAMEAARIGPGLMEDDKRKAWEGKYEYTTRLVSSLYDESLLDRAQFLRFLIVLLEPSFINPATTTMGQLPFVLLLLEDHLGDILASETATARLVRGCLLRLRELEDAPPSTLKNSLVESFTSLVRSAFLANPDAFVPILPSPVYPFDRDHAPFESGYRLESLLVEGGLGGAGGDDLVLRETIKADLEDLQTRRAFPSAALAAQSGSSSIPAGGSSGSDRTLLAAVKRLDEIDFPVKLRDVHRSLFVTAPAPISSTPAAPAAPSPYSHNMLTSHSASSSQPTSTSRNRTSISASNHLPVPLSNSSASSLPPPLPITLLAALPLLFVWATTSTRPASPHRRYAVSRLITLELERQAELDSAGQPHSTNQKAASRTSARLNVRRTGGATTSVEDAFVQWVDEQFPSATPTTPAAPRDLPSSLSASAGAGEIKREDVRLLAGELIRAGVLNYGAYLQRMIARGETEQRDDSAFEEGQSEPSVHLWVLRTVPLAVETTGMPGGSGGGARRRVAIGGKQGLEQTMKIEEQLRVAKHELSRLVFSPFSSSKEGAALLLRTVKELTNGGAQWIVTRDVVPEGLAAVLDPLTGNLMIEREALAVAVAVYEQAEDWWGLLQLLVVLLQRSPYPSVLVHLVDVVEAHFSTWTALDGLSELGAALDVARQNSVHSSPAHRRLVLVLRTFGKADHLSSKAKSAVDIDHSNLFPSVTTPPPHALQNPIAELQTLLIDASQAAVDHIASFILSHFLVYANWTSVTVDGLVQLLPRLASIDPAVQLLGSLQQRGATGIEFAVSDWIQSMSPAQLVSTLGGQSGPLLVRFLGELVSDAIIPAPTMVKDVLLPAWRSLLGQLTPAVADSQPLHLDESIVQAMETLRAIAVDLILVRLSPTSTADVDSPSTPASGPSPATLAVAQRKASRRASLFVPSFLPHLSQLLSVLIVRQEVALAASRADLAELTGAAFIRFAGLPELQALILRDPKTLRTELLEGEVIRSMPKVQALRPKLLAGVLLALKDGGAATPVNLVSTEDWDLFLSGLTLWRLSVSKVEVEACLERLELDTSLSSSDKSEALHTLSDHFLERVCSGEGQSYLGEQVVKCYHGPASDELVSVAFSRLANSLQILSRPAFDSSDERSSALITLRCASRLVDTLLRSERVTSRSSSLDALLEAVKLFLARDDLVREQTAEAQHTLLHVAHLLLVALGCTAKPAEKSTADLYRDCLIACTKLAMMLSKGRAQDCELTTVLLDSSSHILYAFPDLSPMSRPPTLQNLLLAPLEVPGSSLLQLPLSLDLIPDSTFSRLTRLFGSNIPTSLVPNPWELLDHSDPSSTSLTVRRANQPQLSNLGPVDLAAFRAKVVETIPSVTALDAMSTVSSVSAASTITPAFEKGAQTNFDFETPCTNLSVTARGHRRTLAITRALAARLDGGGTSAQAQAQAAGRKRAEASKPASSAPTPTAAAPAPPPAPTPQPPPPLLGRGTKRKASSQSQATDAVDEGEDKSGSSSKAKKVKGGQTGGKAPSKTTASKTTSSKTTAKKKK